MFEKVKVYGGFLILIASCFFAGRFVTASSQITPESSYQGRASSFMFYDPESPCGPLSAAIASKFAGADVTLGDCRAAVEYDASGNTTAKQLIDGLESLGLSAIAVQFSSFPQDLDEGVPLIVNLGSHHWAVVVRRDNNWVLVDPPNQPSTFGRDADWDGFTVLVGTEPSEIRRVADAFQK